MLLVNGFGTVATMMTRATLLIWGTANDELAMADSHGGGNGLSGHHHAPDPVQVRTLLANGVLEIVDSPVAKGCG